MGWIKVHYAPGHVETPAQREFREAMQAAGEWGDPDDKVPPSEMLPTDAFVSGERVLISRSDLDGE